MPFSEVENAELSKAIAAGLTYDMTLTALETWRLLRTNWTSPGGVPRTMDVETAAAVHSELRKLTARKVVWDTAQLRDGSGGRINGSG